MIQPTLFGKLFWKMLLNEDLEPRADPNNPMDAPRMVAEQKQKVESLKNFMQGVGKPIVDMWVSRLKEEMVELLTFADVDKCTCRVCSDIRKMRAMIDMIMDAQMAIMGNDKE